jgi:hypothetical protein
MTDISARDGPLVLEPPISWSAIVAGALVALAVSTFLTVLASGFGYNLVAGSIASQRALDAFTPALGAAAVAIQVVSAGLGAYLAGRLRHLWLGAHADEAHFRDTAHGLVVWALATVAGLLLATAVAPYAASLTPTAATPAPDPVRAAHILAQSAFFTAVGMILSAFIAAVAARIGGLRTEEMHGKPRA